MVFSIRDKRHVLGITFMILAILSGVMCAFLFIKYQKLNNSTWDQAKEKAIAHTEQASEKLVSYIDIVKQAALSIANEISNNSSMTEEQIEQLLQKYKKDELTAVGVAFLPYAFDKNVKLFGRTLSEKDGKIQLINIEQLYDYTDQKNTWFRKPLEQNKLVQNTYVNKELGTMLAEYGVPIYRTDENGTSVQIGVAFADQSLKHLSNIVNILLMASQGYWFILTDNGRFLAYPQSKYEDKSIFDIAKDIDNPHLADMARKIMKGESVVFSYENEITGAKSWLVSSPIAATPWSLVGVFDQEEFFSQTTAFRHAIILTSLAFILMMLCMCLSLSMFWDSVALRSILVVVLSCAFFIQIGLMWYAIYNYPLIKENESNIHRITSQADLFHYLKDNFPPYTEGAEFLKPEYKDLSLEERLLKVIRYKQFIPTGIYINSLQLSEKSEIKLSAYFWQRLTKGIHDNVPPGFVFIQTNNATIVEETSVTQNNDTLITYDVFAQLNQFLSYTLYPFDMKSLRIKYWSKTSSEIFYFIPDFNSYQLINPRSLPGVDPDVYIPGWQLVGSYFGYQKLPYTNNFGNYLIGPFGIYEKDDLSVEPQPFFEIIIRRNLSNALISDLLPILVIAVLLFLVLLGSGPESNAYLTAISIIFFATISAQIRFRTHIPQEQIVYLETFYFILYIIMICLLVNGFLVQNKVKIPLITTNNNVAVRLLYWPVLCGLFSVVSLFYLW